jgi:hypothetical protein
MTKDQRRSQEVSSDPSIANFMTATNVAINTASLVPQLAVPAIAANTLTFAISTYLDAMAKLLPNRITAVYVDVSHQSLPAGTQGRIETVHARAESGKYQFTIWMVGDALAVGKGLRGAPNAFKRAKALKNKRRAHRNNASPDSDAGVPLGLPSARPVSEIDPQTDRDFMERLGEWTEYKAQVINTIMGRISADTTLGQIAEIGPFDYGWFILKPEHTIVGSLSPSVLATTPKAWTYSGVGAGEAQVRVLLAPDLFGQHDAAETHFRVNVTGEAPKRPQLRWCSNEELARHVRHHPDGSSDWGPCYPPPK